jgi:DNA mismatch repair protein MutS
MKQLIKHYQSIKAKYPDAIVLFRVGDYYKTFNEDARIIAKHLDFILKEVSIDSDIKTIVSLPFHCIDNAMRKLVQGPIQGSYLRSVGRP